MVTRFGTLSCSSCPHEACLRADVSYFLCCTRTFPRATKEIGDVCTQAATKPSRYAFSARSNLDLTVSCDVTKSSQKSRRQRGKRERKGETRLGSTNLSAPKRQKKTKIECLRVTSLKIKFVKLLNLSGGTTSKSVIAKEKSISGQIVSQRTPYKIFLNFNRS